MDDPFFLAPGSKQRKRRRVEGRTRKRKADTISDAELGPSDDEDLSSTAEEQGDVVVETAAEKRLRLAKALIAEVEEEERQRKEEKEIDIDVISHRLRNDMLEEKGMLQIRVAHEYTTAPDMGQVTCLRNHALPITCVAVTEDSTLVFTGSKDGAIIKWDAATGKRLFKFEGGRKHEARLHQGHVGHVLSLAVSTDGRFLASAGRDQLVIVWDVEGNEFVKKFKGHRDMVCGVAFRRHTHQLFSASADRTVKIWNVDQLSYVETLYGHQDAVLSVDSMNKERCITAGGRDSSVRLWKVIEESQLVFQAAKGSLDCVAMISENNFVSGSDTGMLCLWDVMKKKPMCKVPEAHGPGNWICSVAALRMSDLVASGSSDGLVRLWHCGERFRSMTALIAIPVLGYVNALSFAREGLALVAGVGQEHRLGRWGRCKCKNRTLIIPLSRASAAEAEEEDE